MIDWHRNVALNPRTFQSQSEAEPPFEAICRAVQIRSNIDVLQAAFFPCDQRYAASYAQLYGVGLVSGFAANTEVYGMLLTFLTPSNSVKTI
jgi:hypothetical protein